VSFGQATRILKKHRLQVSKWDFYNVDRRDRQGGQLTKIEELNLLLEYLDKEDFRYRLLEDYELDEAGNPAKRVVQALFFTSSEQIRLARRFVSGFVYLTDATFNTNRLRLPLSILTGIDNTGSTFPFGFGYQIAESARIFAFFNDTLTELIFYNIPGPEVCCGDLAGGLNKAAAEFNAAEEKAAAEKGRKAQTVVLQLCQWHGVEAIKRKLIATGRYSKERRDELTNLIWAWIKAGTIQEIYKQRELLRAELYEEEQVYLDNEYQPKEPQICEAYIKTYRNLGIASTQRSEGYHPVIKAVTHRTKPLADAVRAIRDLANSLAENYDKRVNNDRRNLPRLLDKQAFRSIASLLTHSALNKTSIEWEATKKIGAQIEDGDESLKEQFEGSKECKLACELPVRWGLPCRHWLYQYYKTGALIPLSLFHPRWLLDHEPTDEEWVIGGRREAEAEAEAELPHRYAGDRYRDRGKNMTLEAANQLVELQAGLKGQEAEEFAQAFREMGDKLASKLQKQRQSRTKLPAQLPEAVLVPHVRHFRGASKRKRGMTAREAAEAAEQDAARKKRSAQRQVDLQAAEAEEDFRRRVEAHTEEAQAEETQTEAKDDSSQETEEEDPMEPPPSSRRSTREKRPTKKVESQQRRLVEAEAEAEVQAAKAKGGRKLRKSAMREVSQLLLEFTQ
jgi:hypothetical protein